MPDFSQLPSVEILSSALAEEVPLPRALVTGYVQRALAACREQVASGRPAHRQNIESDIRSGLRTFAASRLQPVINATGILIHTNLGRSPLGERAAAALQAVATGYSNLEFHLPDGKRGPRAAYLETALATLLDAPAATAVNNCAAALVVTLRHLVSPDRPEVLVSRGELLEIGGGFRIPEVLETSGATLVEVGTTNKTRLDDYARASTSRTALILKVHRSNFYVGGFTSEPAAAELASLARQLRLPLVEDLGSGAVLDTGQLAPIDHEPTPQEALRNGIDLVTFSGDKLLGGPQAGIIAGRSDLVAGIKAEPLFRAIRCDKLILATMQECLEDYLRAPRDTAPDIPVLRFLATPLDNLQRRAESLAALLADLPADVRVIPATSRTGGGTMPGSELPSVALAIAPHHGPPEQFASRLRSGSPPVVGYLKDDCFLLNLRAVFPAQDHALAQAVRNALATNPARRTGQSS